MTILRTINLRSLLLMLVILLVALPTVSANAQPLTQSLAQPLAQPSAAGVQLVHSDQSGVELTIQIPDYKIEDLKQNGSSACRQITLPGYQQTQEPGQPVLPVLVLLLGVPPHAEVSARASAQPPMQPHLRAQSIGGLSELCTAMPADRDSSPGQVSVDQTFSIEPSAAEMPPLVQVVDMGLMRSQRLIRLEVYPVQVDSTSGNIIVHQQLDVQIQFEGNLSGESVLEPGSFESMFRSQILNYQSARQWRLSSSPPPQVGTWTPPQPAYKVLVQQQGLYALSENDLRAAGLPVDTLDPRTFRIFEAGQEIAITVTGEEDASLDQDDVLLFYGEGADTRYTDTNIFWLSYGGNPGLRMSDSTSLADGVDVASHVASVRSETNIIYVPSLPKEEGFDHWYGRRIDAFGQDRPGNKELTLVLDHVASGDHEANLAVSLAGNADVTHHLRLYINGHVVHDDTWEGRTVYQENAQFSQSLVNEGNNVVRVELANDTPNQLFDQAYIDWLRLEYQRTYGVDDDLLFFGGDDSGPLRFQLDGFTSSDIELYDITDPAQVSYVTGASVTALGGGEFSLGFGADQPAPPRYLALTTAQRLQPAGIIADSPSDLQSMSNGADYIIISHADFIETIQPLAAQRLAQGMRVEVIDVQDIYDEFGYGMMSSEGIEAFLAYAYAQWQPPAPAFVLLVGDGTYDMRHYLSTSAPTYLPPYLAMVDFDLGETAADNRFVTVSGADVLPDMHVGRLPANTASEAQVMVNKILQYETLTPEDAWTKNVLFVSDDLEGGGGNFFELSDAIADGYVDPPANTSKLLPEDYARTKTYMSQTCPAQDPSVACRGEIIDTINTTGALFVSYVGHGSKTFWAKEHLWDISAVQELTNGEKLPIMLPMTCNEGFFHEAELGLESTSEAVLRLSGGGAVASWAPTGYGLSTGHDLLERGFFLSAFHKNAGRLGVATDAGKLYLIAKAPPGKYLDLIDTFLLLGDPALLMPVPESEPESNTLFLPVLTKGTA